MTADNTVSRSLHDLGLATWFGGSLMGAVGLNGAAAQVQEPKQRLRVATAGWNRWTPVNLAGITAHLAGGAVLLGANKGRVASQQGVVQATVVKTALTGAALAATAWSRALGAKLDQAGEVPVGGGTDPSIDTPQDVAKAQRQLKVLQWVIPALTGAVLVVSARMGEQQRPNQGHRGPGSAAAPRSLGGRQLSSALPAGGREGAVGVPVRATYHGPAGWAAPVVGPGYQRPQGGPQTDNLKEWARRRVMVEGRLCAATVAAPQGGKR